MKKRILIAAAFLMLATFSACKKVDSPKADPANFITDTANIILNSGSCDKIANALSDLIDANGDAFVQYLVEQKKAGKSLDELTSLDEDTISKLENILAECEDSDNEAFHKIMNKSDELNRKIDAAFPQSDAEYQALQEKRHREALKRLNAIEANLAEAEKGIAEAGPEIPPDPDIDPKALIGVWTQIVDSDPDVYTFMENGKCSLSNTMYKTPKECTYELLTPKQAYDRFNLLIVHYLATDTEEAYDNRIRIRLSNDRLDFPDHTGKVSEFNKYKKSDSNAVKPDNAEGN